MPASLASIVMALAFLIALCGGIAVALAVGVVAVLIELVVTFAAASSE